MELLLKRVAKKETYTIGRLYVNGNYFSDTLEDKDRGLTSSMRTEEIGRKKVYGETAIPTGKYKIDMCTVSPKFKDRSWGKPYSGKIPRLVGVPGFEGVLIHPLNDATDSLGCIGVGENKEVGRILNSRRFFMSLMEKHLLPAKNRNEDIWLTII